MDNDLKEEKKDEIEENANEAMEIEEEQSKNEDIRNNLMPDISFPMDIENMQNLQQINNFRFNKFCNQNQFLAFSQSKAHSGLPSDLNKIYYKKMNNPC